MSYHEGEGLKHCNRCDKDKPLDQFYKDAKRPDGKYPYCKVCFKEADPLANLRRRCNKVGITIPEYMDAYAAQKGRCAICRCLLPEFRNEHLDHDHVTGKFRGILCADCNIGLGRFFDNPWRLLRAVRYLNRSNQ